MNVVMTTLAFTDILNMILQFVMSRKKQSTGNKKKYMCPNLSNSPGENFIQSMASFPSACMEYTWRVVASKTDHLPEVVARAITLPSGE